MESISAARIARTARAYDENGFAVPGHTVRLPGGAIACMPIGKQDKVGTMALLNPSDMHATGTHDALATLIFFETRQKTCHFID